MDKKSSSGQKVGAFYCYGLSVKRIRYVWLKKQVANPLPAAASPAIKKWRSSRPLAKPTL
ncbi:hypothetical protein [Cardinium endosymbiont of Philonthus spinipes]|uniref:hypothetical protein n=1 Tax=Cardinium endosymbiont of Philonthus spinipes TaxID=3077941 RepID=UPI00313E6D35